MGEAVTILLAGLAAVGQVANVFLNLRIRTALLEQDKQQRIENETRLKDYVTEKTCHARHWPGHAPHSPAQAQY
jgi:hypothetical protein